MIGPGGVGKTRLARAVVAAEADAGAEIAIVIATRAAATVPLGALAPLVDDPGDRPERLIPIARRAIRERAGERRLVLLVDDAHLLDDVSAGVLLALTDLDQVRCVLTVRSGEPVPDAITALWKDAGWERFDLDPLGEPDADELAELIAGGALDAPSRNEIRRAARGSPLAITELLREARRSGLLIDDHGVLRLDGPVPLTDRLTELIAGRLRGLGHDDLRALALIALADPVSLERLRRLGIAHETLVRLEQRHHVTIADDGRRTEVRPEHPLIGEVALDQLGTLVRRELLTALVDDITYTGADLDDLHPDHEVEVASWTLEAGLDADPDLLVRAARRCWVRTDHRRTAEFARAAWNARADAATGHLLGYALGRTGRPAEADAVLAEAWQLAEDDRTRLLVGQARVDVLFRGLADAAAASEWSRTVEAAIDDHAMRLEVVAGRATLAVQTGRIPAAVEMAAPLLAEGTPERAFVTASYASGLGLALGGRTDEAMQVAAAALPVHERIWRDELFSTEPGIHHIVTAIALAESGRIDEAERLTGLGVAVAGESGRGYGFGFFAMLHGMVLVRRGRLGTGARWCREAVTALRSAGYPGTGRWALATIAQAGALRSELDEARQALAAADELHPHTAIRLNEAVVDDARGWVQFCSGDPEQARTTFRAAVEHHASVGAIAGAVQLAHSLARAGEPEQGAEILGELAAVADGELVPLRHQHARALAADDADALEALGGDLAERGLDLDAAEAFGAAHRLQLRHGHHRRAMASRRRMSELLTRCEGAMPPTLRDLHTETVEPLSRREREIAVLVADGHSSRVVAERLHVSRRTVDNHLQRIYRKLGITSRDELRELLTPGPDPTRP